MWKLLNQTPAGDVYSAGINEPAGSDRQSAQTEGIQAGTGNYDTSLGRIGGVSAADTEPHSLGNLSNFQSDLMDAERVGVDAVGLPRSHKAGRRGADTDYAGDFSLLRNHSSCDGTAERVSDESVEDLSSEFRSSLDSARSTVQKTLDLEDQLEEEQTKKAEVQDEEDDFEIAQSRGRSM